MSFRFLFLIPSLVLCFCILSCKNGNKVDLPKSQAEYSKTNIEIRRYDQAFFSINPADLKTELSKIQTQYDFFLSSGWDDALNLIRFTEFASDPEIRALYGFTEKQFLDITSLKTALDDAFSQLRMHFPKTKVPLVYTYVSGLDIDLPIIYTDTVLAIALDLFLGKDVEPYKHAGFPIYKTLRMTPEHLLPACMLAVSDSLVKIDDSKLELLNEMIRAGKQLYLLDVTLPKTSDHLKIGYSATQLEWCKENEGNIWGFFTENQLLYTTTKDAYTKFIVDAPFSVGLPPESPGRLGAWVGWQIVRAYMNHQSGTTLDALMNNLDYQNILSDSKYKPKK